MDIRQFSMVAGTVSGRHRYMQGVGKALDAPVYTFDSSAKQCNTSDRETLTTYKEFERSLKIGETVSEKSELKGADLLIFHGLLPCAAAGSFDAPVVLMGHGGSREHTYWFDEKVSAQDPTSEYVARNNVGKIRKGLKKLYNLPDAILSDSDFCREEVKKWFDVDSTVIHSPVDRNLFEVQDGVPDKDYYVSVQRLVWTKRVERQIEAFKGLDESLHIVGSGPLESVVEDEVEKYDNITYRGRKVDDDLVRILNEAKGLVFTGLPENFAYAPREALACGTPVIVPENGGFKEMFDDGDGVGVKYSPDSFGALSLRRAVDSFNPDSYDRGHMREFTRRYSLDNFKQQMGDVIENVLKRQM